MTDKTFEKYKLVVDEWFINGFNGTKAYQKYYPKASTKSAAANYEKILRITEVKEYKEQIQKETHERNKMSIDECVVMLSDMAKFDLSDIYNEDGALKPLKDIPKKARLAIEALDTEEIKIGGEKIGEVRKVKLSSRRANIIELLKHFGGYEKDNAQRKPEVVQVLTVDPLE